MKSCLFRYEDGTGGCDGCINWAGVGHAFPRGTTIFAENKDPDLKEAMPRAAKTNNNKLELTARSLELIYTVADWPPGAPVLPVSLKESGKSRADLWQFAGNVGLENAIGKTNDNCRLGDGNPAIIEPMCNIMGCSGQVGIKRRSLTFWILNFFGGIF